MSPERLDPAGLDAVAVAVAVVVVVVVVVVVDVDVVVVVVVVVDVDTDVVRAVVMVAVAVDGELELAGAVEPWLLGLEAGPEEPPAGAVDEPSDVDVASPVLAPPTELDPVSAGIGWPAVPEPVVPHAVAAARRTQRPVHERRCIADRMMPCRSQSWRDPHVQAASFRPPPRREFRQRGTGSRVL